MKIDAIYNWCCVEASFDYFGSQHFLLFIRRCAPSYMMYCSNTYHPELCIWQTKYIYDIRSMILFFGILVPASSIVFFRSANLEAKATSILSYELKP